MADDNRSGTHKHTRARRLKNHAGTQPTLLATANILPALAESACLEQQSALAFFNRALPRRQRPLPDRAWFVNTDIHGLLTNSIPYFAKAAGHKQPSHASECGARFHGIAACGLQLQQSEELN